MIMLQGRLWDSLGWVLVAANPVDFIALLCSTRCTHRGIHMAELEAEALEMLTLLLGFEHESLV
jgi:hypothetical protein